MPDTRYPKEATEGIRNRFTAEGVSLISGAVSSSEVEVLDLLCEGEIEGLVTGEYLFSGVSGEVGYRSGVFFPFPIAPTTTDNRWLRSIYWNEVPVINSNNKYNFQQVNASFTPGLPNGALLNQSNAELTVSRTIGERLRGSELTSANLKNFSANEDFAKYYRIFNKRCKGVIINVRVNQLFQTITKGEKFGDIVDTTVNYKIFLRPFFASVSSAATSFTVTQDGTLKDPYDWGLAKDEFIVGKITYGYIRSVRIDFAPNEIFDKKNFAGWEIKIVRVTPESLSGSVRNQTFIDSITEIYSNTFTYPDSAIVRSRFNAEFFSQVPSRAFDTKLLKVKVPSNYNPITKVYTEGANGWDGTFATDKQWTDNPASCFYDLLTNSRYGLGKYIDSNLVDKWTLYEIGKYCDTLVPDGYGGLEPRFVCNLIINTRDEAYKVINDFASIFRGIVYYGAGTIFTVQDSPKPSFFQYSNANVENGDFIYSSSSKKVRHTVALVRYNDKSNFHRPAAEYVEDVDGIRRYGIRELEISAFGCTSRGQALRLGRWALLSEMMETETVNFSAGLDASILRPGDVFKVFDSNRKVKRHAGRTFLIENYHPDSGKVMLDSTLSLTAGTMYQLSLLTPGYYYDPTAVSNLVGSDFSGIRRPQIQTLNFSGGQTSTVSGKTQIMFYEPFNTGEYTVSGNLVWMLQLPSGVTNQTESFEFPDSGMDYYRAIKIEEKDAKYSVLGIQYAEHKYLEIESGIGFERPQIEYQAQPMAPAGLTLVATNPFDTIGTKVVDYSFVINNYSGTTSYRVFAKKDDYANMDVPSGDHLIANLPLGQSYDTYLPSGTGNYFFRVYAVNDTANLYSTGFASGKIIVQGINRIQDVTISSLTFETDTGINPAGHKSTGEFTNTDPIFTWQVGFNEGAIIPSSFKYRVSVRSQSANNTPSSTIYYQETGLEPDPSELKYVFSLDTNVSGTSPPGPYREFDLVVEAIDSDGNTSAGNTVSPLNEVWSNPQGYDIFAVTNPRVTGINLTSGTDHPVGYRTQQWIDAHGNVNIYFQSGTLPVDIYGGYIFSSTGLFTSVHVTGNVNPPVNIHTGEFYYDYPGRLFTSSAGLTNIKTGYTMIGFYDKFDAGLKINGLNFVSGKLPLTRLVRVVPSGSLKDLDIMETATIRDSIAPNNNSRIQVKSIVEGGNTFTTPVFVDENNNDVIYYSKVRE